MTLEESIAKFNLGVISVSCFPEIALKAVNNGIESESLLILAGMNDRDNSFEIRQYLNQVIEELCIRSFESLDAAFILANYYVNQLKLGKLNSVETVGLIEGHCWSNCYDQIKSNEYRYDGIKFERIIGDWYEYCELDGSIQYVKSSGKSVRQLRVETESELKQLLINWQSEFLKDKLEKI